MRSSDSAELSWGANNMPINPIVMDYLLKKNKKPDPLAMTPTPIPPSSNFDVAESSSPMAMKGNLPTPPVEPNPFALTLDDVNRPGLTETMFDTPAPDAEPPQMADVAPIMPPAAMPSKPAQIAATPEPTPEIPPVPAPQAKESPFKGSLSVIGKALAGYADARNAGIDKKSNFLETLQNNNRQAEVEGREKVKFDQEQSTIKNASDPKSPESRFAQSYMAKLTGRKPAEFKDFSYQRAKELLPTVEKAWAAEEAMETRKATQAAAHNTKHDSDQDRLEHNAIQAVQSLRGDKSLADAESKRDAAITVHQTIQNLKEQKRMPSKLEYYDLLGQMWKARTGSAPTDQAIKDLDSTTFKGDLGKAITYISGQTAPATTEGVLNNIQSFAEDSGRMADRLHAGYMKTHLIKPSGLDDDRWAPIASTGRGISFDEAVRKGAGNGNEVRRKTADGRIIVYDALTKKPLREETL